MRNYEGAAQEMVDNLENGSEREAREADRTLTLSFDDGAEDPFFKASHCPFVKSVSSLDEVISILENSAQNYTQSHYAAGAAMSQLLADSSGGSAFSLADQLGEQCSLGKVNPLFYKSKLSNLAISYTVDIEHVLFAFADARVEMDEKLRLQHDDVDDEGRSIP